MTQVQYSLWVGFALRMARRGWPNLPKKSRRKVASLVKDFFRRLDGDGDIPYVTDWDACRFKTEDGVRVAFPLPPQRRPLIPILGNVPWRWAYSRESKPVYVCDLVEDLLYEENPGNGYEKDRAYRRWDELWGCRVRCCLRAGLDLASGPSGGVVGFSVGDLRRMYRGNLPEFVRCGWGEDGHCLDSAPDDAGVWL